MSRSVAGARPRRAPRRPLPRDFYDRDTRLVARELLGAILELRTSDGVASGRIVETEAYLGPEDPACHAVVGITARTRDLHGPPGTSYVYFIYGTYWCFNAVTQAAGIGSAVLVRAIEPLVGLPLMRRRRPRVRRDVDLTNGPGKLCLALGIDGTMSGRPLDRGALRLLDGEPIDDARVVVTPRIGISQAADWPLRYFVSDSAWVSRTPRAFARQPWSLPRSEPRD